MTQLTESQLAHVKKCQHKIARLTDEMEEKYFVAGDKGQYSAFTKTWSMGASQIRRQFIRNVCLIFENALEIHQIDLKEHGLICPVDDTPSVPFGGAGEGA